jgi:hypothetical protein
MKVARVVPPGGFVSFGQQTPATQARWSLATSKSNGARGGRRSAKRRKAAAKSAPARRRKRRAVAGARFKKGSPAAKRHMAKLRRMRKRR